MPKAQELSAIEETLKQVKSGGTCLLERMSLSLESLHSIAEAALDAEIAEVQKALKALTSEGTCIHMSVCVCATTCTVFQKITSHLFT